MNINQLVPPPSEKIIFSLRDMILVPKISGCYVLASFDNIILYIGLSKNLFKRFRQHLDNPQKILPTENGKPAWFYYKTVDELNLHKIERTWMNEYQRQHGNLPVLNKIHSPLI